MPALELSPEPFMIATMQPNRFRLGAILPLTCCVPVAEMLLSREFELKL